MKRYLTVACMVLSACLYAQTDVTFYGPGTQGKDYGVAYALPKTVFNIEIEAEKVTYTPGEFCRYADRYLRLPDVSGEPQEYWLIKRIILHPTGVPDPENAFFVKLKDKTLAPLLELTPEGVIASINQPEPTLKRATSEDQENREVKRAVNPRNFMTEEILMANSTAKMAELVAKEIYNLRESKNSLVRGQADNMPQDGQSLKLMLDNIDEQERALTEMFAGTTDRELKRFTIKVTPNQDIEKQVLFRFSRKLGVIGADNLAGEPVYLDLTDLKSVNVDLVAKARKKPGGIAYNVPGKALVRIYTPEQEYMEQEVLVTQFGMTEYLAPALFEKKSMVRVTFDPVTGGLVKVDL